jgi:dihydropteroate synthase
MIEWLKEPRVMGILNITPDSFHAASRVETIEEAMKQVSLLIDEGAEIIDLGGQSTRPGAIQISAEEENQRVLPVLEAIRQRFPSIKISIDTYHSDVAEACVGLGIDIINDVSNGCIDPRIHAVAAETQTPYVLMHNSGDPLNLTRTIPYQNVVEDVYLFFQKETERLSKLGIQEIIIDLGFGFAKTTEQNFLLLENLDRFKALGFPILVGVSRKKMIQSTLNVSAEEALNGTTVLNTAALLKGANILRVHDVQEAAQAVTLVRQLTRGGK